MGGPMSLRVLPSYITPYSSTKAATDNEYLEMNEHGRVPINL